MRLSLAALLLLAAGCAEPDAPAPEADAPGPALPDTAAMLDLPATRGDTVLIEGEPQETTLHLVREDDAPLPFATYRPEDVAYEPVSSGEGDGYRFTFGEPPYDASLVFFVPSAESGLDVPKHYVRSLAGEGAAFDQLGDVPPWAEAAYTWRRGDRHGSLRAGTRDGRRFYVVEDMQQELGDGFGPRAGAILRTWRWLPGGEPLE